MTGRDAMLTPAEARELAAHGGTAYDVPASMLARDASSQVFFARSQAEQEADLREGQYIEWTGGAGRLVPTPQYQADCEAWMEAS